jgi:hypothetical protein
MNEQNLQKAKSTHNLPGRSSDSIFSVKMRILFCLFIDGGEYLMSDSITLANSLSVLPKLRIFSAPFSCVIIFRSEGAE